MESKAAKYPVVLYLNQKYALDILAMMEGGFSQIETLTSTQTTSDEKSGRVSGGIGFRNVFGLLGVSLASDRGHSEADARSTETKVEKIHTPNSLFAKVRDRLHADGLVGRGHPLETAPGEFVELRVILQKNSLVHAIGALVTVMRSAVLFQDAPAPQKGKGPKQPLDPAKAMLQQMEALLQQIEGGSTAELMGNVVTHPDIKIAVSLDKAFIADESMSDLIDGEFGLIGKVTRVIGHDSESSIDLLRKTSLGAMGGTPLETMVSSIQAMQEAGMRFPDVVTEVRGPALQVIPLAIFS